MPTLTSTTSLAISKRMCYSNKDCRVLTKFMNGHFEIQDNMADKKLLAVTRSKGFTVRKGVTSLMKEVTTFFAEEFTDKNEKEARKKLDYNGRPIRKKDLMLLSFFAGLFTFMIPLLLFFMLVPSSDGRNYYNTCWISTISTFRMTFLII